MSLKSVLKEVDKLKAEFEALKPLKKEDEDRLWKKFRLDWNYNSNHIEGNTLTYGETELLLIFGKTTGDHTIREYEEMQAHDVAIKQVQQAADDKERPLTEQFIRLLNETLLVKPFWKEAQTADGQDTRRQIIPGEYKKFPNTVRLENGELFHYASPQDVPILMGDLIASYNQAVAEGKHPIEIAAMLHYKFVRIHPFDDGNGRVARLLMNYVLLHHGYQPAIIKTEGKKEYLNALNKTDILNAEVENINNVEPFAEYLANQLLWSYEISLKAAKGESVVEKGDLDKLLKNIDKKLSNKKEISYIKDNIGIEYFFQNIYKKFFTDFYIKSESIRNLFLYYKYNLYCLGEGAYTFEVHNDKVNRIIPTDLINKKRSREPHSVSESNDNNINFINKLMLFDFESPFNSIYQVELLAFDLNIIFEALKKANNQIYSININTRFTLGQVSYIFSIPDFNIKIEKYYDEPISEEEIDNILFQIADKLKNDLI